jgi:2-iminobutanoate/2-iminopropanoate deaminase
LEAGGSSLDKIVKTTVFLSDVNSFAEMNGVYATFFGDNPPARSTVQAVLPRAGALVEIECIAIV